MRRRGFGWIVWWSVLAVATLLCVPRPARSAPPPERVSVLTMGPGAHPFTRFGHNAILLEWGGGAARPNAVYNFGTFSFDGMKGVSDFMAGRFRYWLSVSSLESTVRSYGAAGRSLRQQELRLTPAERAELGERLARQALPEHRYYDYDYYRDNCSTRVRDVIDELLNGQLKRSAAGAGRLTFRQHTLRLLADAPAIYAGLDVALGAPTDRPTTRWEELFLPQELHDALARATRELDGDTLPLVVRERELLSSRFPAPPAAPPERRPWFLLAGLMAGATFIALGFLAQRRPTLRVAFGVYSAVWGSVLGLLGCVLSWFWFFSKHVAAHQNRALLGAQPWALALAVLGIALAYQRGGSADRLRRVVLWSAVASLGLLALSIPASGRESLRLASFFVPLWGGWWLGAYRLDSSHDRSRRHRAA